MKDKIQNHFQGRYLDFYAKYLKAHIRKIGGKEYQTLCPFHADTKPSFTFNEENGKYFCHGCGKGGNALHFYAKTHSLDDKKDFPKILKGICEDFGISYEERERKLVKTYEYVDTEAKPVFQVCRFEPKEFKQRRPDGKGGWIWKLDGVQTVLYRLPEVIKSQEIIIVEGEKDVDSLGALGFTATASPMGAGKWRDHYSSFLKDKDVVLIPDNDNEGRKHMAQVGASLNGICKSLKWLDLPDLPSKGDVSDFIVGCKGQDEAMERLSVMIEAASPYTPQKQKTLEDVIVTCQDFRALEIPTRSVYLYPWLKEDSITLVSGERGIGKSFFAHSIANAVSKGESFGPWLCDKSVPVLILDGEMPESDLQERIQALHLDSERPSPLYLYSDALANQFGISRAHLLNEAWREKVRAILLANHIKLWIVDNLASLATGGDENLKKDYDPINTWLLDLRFQGIATILLHHTGKGGGQRGTSAKEDNVDTSIILKKPADWQTEDGCRFIVSFTKARIPQSARSLIGEYEFRLTEKDGVYLWTCENVKRENKKEILRMLDDGADYEAIIKTLDITKGYISRVRKEALNQNFITPKNSLTDAGRVFCGL